MTRMSEAEYAALMNRQLQTPLPVVKPSKYRNCKVVIDGVTFDSKKEGSRYRHLKQLEHAERISELVLQPEFCLAPAVIINGKKKRSLCYRADFQYRENGKTIVEDVKGMLTEVYKIKRHLMKSLLNIDILES
jgi:Protein of unknown function (DUF1064)